MSFGIFKKLKDGFKKAGHWIRKALPQARKILEKAEPIVKEIIHEAPKIIPNEKVRKVLTTAEDVYDLTKTGVRAADEAINRDNYGEVTDWTKAQLIPRIKMNRSKL